MNNPNNTAITKLGDADDTRFGLLDLLIIFAKHKNAFIAFPLAFSILAAGVSLVLPLVYQASAKILPPQQQQGGAAAILSQFGGLAGAASGMGGLKGPNELYIAMMRSRTVADRLIARFKLEKEFDLDSHEKIRTVLEKNTEITSGKDGIITISFESNNKEMVAPMTNAYIEELIKLTTTLAVTDAAKRRLFFEKQLEQAKNNLATAEVRLKRALDQRGVISVDSQSRTILETVAKLRAQISAKQIQLSSMEAFVTDRNPEHQRVEKELSSLRAELGLLENGNAGNAGKQEDTPNPSGLENIKVLRDVKYYEMLYEMLAKQYEVARLDEAKDPAVVQVLDPAVTPERKFKPKRAVMVLLAAFIGLFAALFYCFLSELKHRILRLPQGEAQLTELKTHMRFK